MAYGKILDGKLILQYGIVNYKGRNIINPSDSILRELGWYPITYTSSLPDKDGFIVKESFEIVPEQEVEEEIIPSHIFQKWSYEEIPTLPPSEEELRQVALYNLAEITLQSLNITDEQANEMRVLYPKFDDIPIGETLYDGTNGSKITRLQYNDILYKVIKTHQKQADWTPDTAHSLFTPIGNPEAGTKDNPIEWVDGMESETGKYYTDAGVLYIGLEDSKIGLYGKPKDLPRYFKKVE